MNVIQGLRARLVEGSLWTSESLRIELLVILWRGSVSQERGNELEISERQLPGGLSVRHRLESGLWEKGEWSG